MIAKELKTSRESKKIKINDAAKKLNVNLKYLEALENGQLDKLPAGPYGKKILNEYAFFLDLDSDFLTKLWELETENQQKEIKQNLFSHKVPHLAYFLTIPRILKNLTIILAVLICITYLGYYIRNIIEAPLLIVSSPAENTSISQNFINIYGATEPEANVTINNETVLIEPNGDFFMKVNLSNDLNTISIIAKKKYSKENTIIRRVLVKPIEDN